MGSFVYAMPDVSLVSTASAISFVLLEPSADYGRQRYNTSETMSTILYNNPSSLDFATRLAKVLARRTGKAVHVGSSVSFESSAQGGTVEEEVEGFKRIVETVMAQLSSHTSI